jgi:glycosyl hydrolase family 25
MDPLIVDTYVGDRPATIEVTDVMTLINAGPPWHGLVHKLSQGTYETEVDRIKLFRPQLLAHPHYAVDFFEGFYHYADFSIDPVKECDYFWALMQTIGGERAGTLWAMIDVERGGQKWVPTSAWQLIDHVSKWADRYHQHSGRLPTLYGGELLRSLGVHAPGAPIQLMGCGRNAIASYTSQLTVDVIARTGADPAHLLDWQYCGDGVAYLAGYPSEAPGFGKIDISVITFPGGLAGVKAAL